MNLDKIPATVVTGFLGSGKTTILSSVLQRAGGKRIAVIVNEFGEMDIDASLLRGCPLDCDEENTQVAGEEDGIYELANGCICCTVEEEFLPVMRRLIERNADLDHILIETSGLALPKPLVQAFNWPDIRQHCTVDAVITVVDGPAVAAGRFAENETLVEAQRKADENLDHDSSLQELLEDQLSAADLVVVSKNDLLSDEQRVMVRSLVERQVPPGVKTVHLDNGEAPLDLLLGIQSASEDRIDAVHNHHDHHHVRGQEHDHAHEHFDSFLVTLGETTPDLLDKTLRRLLDEYAVYRVKGFSAVPGKPMRQVIQGVGQRINRHFDRPWEPGEPRLTQLVFIGRNLDRNAFYASLETAAVR